MWQSVTLCTVITLWHWYKFKLLIITLQIKGQIEDRLSLVWRQSVLSFTHPASVATPPYTTGDEFILKWLISSLTWEQTACGCYCEYRIESFNKLTHPALPFMSCDRSAHLYSNCPFDVDKAFKHFSCLFFTTFSPPAWPSTPTRSP